MTYKNFDIVAKEKFSFLESEYNFRLSRCDKEDWGYELIYLSDVTGVKITYEHREAYIFIMLYQLVDGGLLENPRNIEDSSILYGYALDDIIILHNPDDLVKPTYEYDEESKYFRKDKGLSVYISAFSDNLKTHAKDILEGDFTIFMKLDGIVKERARRNY